MQTSSPRHTPPLSGPPGLRRHRAYRASPIVAIQSVSGVTEEARGRAGCDGSLEPELEKTGGLRVGETPLDISNSLALALHTLRVLELRAFRPSHFPGPPRI